MSGALIGLIGVATGGIITGGVQAAGAWFDRRLTARSSGRLLYMHLHDAQVAVEDLERRRSWLDLITDWNAYDAAWKEHANALARALDTNGFLHVASAFHCLASLARSKERDMADAVVTGQPAKFDPPAVLLAGYVTQIKAAKVPLLKAAYTWNEKRKGFDRAALAAAPLEKPQING